MNNHSFPLSLLTLPRKTGREFLVQLAQILLPLPLTLKPQIIKRRKTPKWY